MPVYRPAPRVANRATATMHAFPTVAPPMPAPQVANAPGAVSLGQGPSDTLVVSWAAPAFDSTHDAATGYNLRFSPNGAGSWTTVPGVTSPYNLSGLPAGTAFDVQLQSSNAAGPSIWSGTNTLTTATAAPNAPNAAVLTQGTGSDLTVTWTAPAPDGTHNAATGYNLRSCPSGTGAWTTAAGVTSPYDLSGLASGASIDVQVQSANIAGASAWSVSSTLTTATVAPNIPNTPGAASLTQGVNGTLTATWSTPAVDGTHSAATGYNLRSSPSGAGTWTSVSGVASPFSLIGLAAGAAFDVQIQSLNAGGTSAWSAISTLSTAVAVANTPGAASLTQGPGGDLTVTWTAPAVDSTHNAATGFNLRSSPSGAGTWTTASGVASPYDLSSLVSATAYDVQLQATNAAGASPWSPTSTLTTAAGGPYAPNVPPIASVAPPADGTTTKLTVNWTAPAADGAHSAATGFNLRFGPHGAGTWTTVSGVTSPYALTGLTGATAIDVEVQATNAAASPSAWSAIATGTTWGATVVPGNWVAATSQVHSTSVAPNGGVQMIATAAPTTVTGGAFAWSGSNATIPTSGLIAGGADGQTNGWGQYCDAPATAGTFYLWMLAQGAGSATIGALVTSAITVS